MHQSPASTALPRRLLRAAALPEAEWEHRHRRLVGLLWVHAAALPLLALLLGADGSPLHLLGHAAPAALCALVAGAPLGLSRRTR